MNSNPILFYADDDSDDLAFFSEAADELGLQVALFESGEALLEALDDTPEKPSMVFVDLNMPGKSGYDVVESLKASVQFKEVPVIVLSTASDSYSVGKSRLAGANLYVQKPLHMNGMVEALELVLARDLNNVTEDDFEIRAAI